MPIIELETTIKSTLEICFDLSRSIDLHIISTSSTKEKAIEGVTSGLIDLNQTVKWQATHFYVQQKLTSKITTMKNPVYFRDEQIKGIFKALSHDHYFEIKENYVIMRDRFYFESPLGLIGKLLNKIVLTDYLKSLLKKRNLIIKEYAESDKWKQLLNGTKYIQP